MSGSCEQVSAQELKPRPIQLLLFVVAVGMEKPGPDAVNTPKNRILTLLHGDAKLVLRSEMPAAQSSMRR